MPTRAQGSNEQTHKNINNTNDPQKKYRLGTVSKIFYWRAVDQDRRCGSRQVEFVLCGILSGYSLSKFRGFGSERVNL